VFRNFVFIFILFFLNPSYSADSFLTIKQQLDRLQREVNDLSKLVFSGTENTQSEKTKQIETPPNLTAFDLRIYDLEKDIKKLNADFEDLDFAIDDLKILFEELSLSLDTKFMNKQAVSELDPTTTQIGTNKAENNLIVNENSLGNLVINSENLSNESEGSPLQNDDEMNTSIKLSPENEFQQALDLLRSQQFDQAKISLINFIDSNKESNLSGLAHYWLGEIYILRKEYREAALILAEGYQKYPKSVKAPDILYKLSESLVKIEKNTEACSTLKKLSTEYPNYKLLDKSQVRISELGCSIAAE